MTNSNDDSRSERFSFCFADVMKHVTNHPEWFLGPSGRAGYPVLPGFPPLRKLFGEFTQRLAGAHHLARKSVTPWTSYWRGDGVSVCVQTMDNNSDTLVYAVESPDPFTGDMPWYRAHGFENFFLTCTDLEVRMGLPKEFTIQAIMTLYITESQYVKNPDMDCVVMTGFKLKEVNKDARRPFASLWGQTEDDRAPAGMLRLTIRPEGSVAYTVNLPRDPIDAFGKRVWETAQNDMECRKTVNLISKLSPGDEPSGDLDAADVEKFGRRDLCAADGCLETAGLKRCGQCHVVAYCSRECQREHWPRHRKVCRKIAESFV